MHFITQDELYGTNMTLIYNIEYIIVKRSMKGFLGEI